MTLRINDEASILDLAAMYRSKILGELVDPCAHECLSVTLACVSLARRAAHNIHLLLLREPSMKNYEGLVEDFNFESRTITDARIIAMAMTCAARFAAKTGDLSLGIENLAMASYYREVSSRTPKMLSLFTILVKHRDPTEITGKIVATPVREKVRIGCFF